MRCLCRLEAIVQYALPKLYHSARFEHFSQPLRDAVMAWLDKPTDGLFLTGPAGTGKTYLAAAIVRMRIEAGKKATFRRAASLFQTLRDSYSKEGMTEEVVLAEYMNSPMLVLDDLGAGSLSDHERRCTLEIIDRRMNDMRPTIVTSNWDVEQIADRMDERVGSRLATYTLIAFDGHDRRVKK
jgi:DNA replication protein DnaC